jgi:hypothetical protein
MPGRLSAKISRSKKDAWISGHPGELRSAVITTPKNKAVLTVAMVVRRVPPPPRLRIRERGEPVVASVDHSSSGPSGPGTRN